MPEIVKAAAEKPQNIKCLVDVHYIPPQSPIGTRPVRHAKGTILASGTLHDRDFKHMLANKHIELTNDAPSRPPAAELAPAPLPAADAAEG